MVCIFLVVSWIYPDVDGFVLSVVVKMRVKYGLRMYVCICGGAELGISVKQFCSSIGVSPRGFFMQCNISNKNTVLG